MISNESHAVLVYIDQTSTHYHFELTYIDTTTLDLLGSFIPSDSRLNIAQHLEAALQDLVQSMPRSIPAGWQFATNFVGGSFTTTVNSSFDYLSGFPMLPKIDYDASRLLSSFLPMLCRPLDVYYVKTGTTPTAVPSSLSGRDKFVLPDGSTAFVPQTSNWGINWVWLATDQGTSYRSINVALALWLYSYADLPYQSNHLMLLWDSVYTDTSGTWLLGNSGQSIDWTTPTLPQWDETGNYPDPTLNHVAWRYFVSSNMYVKEAIYVPTASYPVEVYPRKDPFDNDGFGPIDDGDESDPLAALDPLSPYNLVHGSYRPSIDLEAITIFSGTQITSKAFPTLPLSVAA